MILLNLIQFLVIIGMITLITVCAVILSIIRDMFYRKTRRYGRRRYRR